MRKFIFAALFAASASISNATLLSVSSETVDIAGAPAGSVTNQISVDFEGQLFGQQMIVQLDSGSLYNNGFGGETAPNGLLIPTFPDLAADTFVTMGGLTVDTAASTLVVGGSTEFAESTGTKLFDDTGIDVAWAPSPGVVVEDQTGYVTAQLTLTDDSNGLVLYYGNGAQWEQAGMIENGVVSFIPEPSTAILAGLALVGFASRRK